MSKDTSEIEMWQTTTILSKTSSRVNIFHFSYETNYNELRGFATQLRQGIVYDGREYETSPFSGDRII